MIVESLAALAINIDELQLLPGNPRKGDIAAVAKSLTAFGQRKPIVANRDGTVIAGNHTLQAARQLGWTQIAVTFVDDDDATAKAYALADNRTAELGGYDDEALVALMLDVHDSDAELLAATGWSESDLAALVAGLVSEPLPLPDETSAPESAPPITKRGDVWLLGPHRVMCGDCRAPAEVDRLLAGATVNVAVTSPPYAEQRDYDESSGFRPIPPSEYVQWFADVARNVADHLADDGSWFVNIKPPGVGLDTDLYVFDLVIAHVRDWGWHFATEFCWERIGVPKSVTRRFKNQFEPVYQFALNDWKMRPDTVRHATTDAIIPFGPGRGNTSWADPDSAVVSQGQKGDVFAGQRGNARKRKNGTSKLMSDVQGVAKDVGEALAPGLAYPGNRLPTFNGSHEATGHTAAFPVGLPQFFIKAYSDEGDVIYDPFMGSGSTLLAAHHERRLGYGMELSPSYVDITCKRWQLATDIVPVLEATGLPCDFTVTS